MRRFSRELALQVLFQEEFASQTHVRNTAELIRSFFESEEQSLGSPSREVLKVGAASGEFLNLDPSVLSYATELVDGVLQFKSQIDQKIQGASQHWKLDRMATVDRNIIRIAIFEMLYLKEPLKPNIVINEAVEIAKKFSTDESAAFINGLLDQARTVAT
jgi:N utilization substance protein B